MTTTTAGMSERDKNTIIAGVLLAMLLAALDQTIIAPAMPTIGHALGQAEYLPWIVTAYLLTATAMAPLYGRISDIHGRRQTIYAAILIFLAGSVISAAAPTMFILIVGRALQGVGGGGLMTMAQTVIGDLVPPRERARYAAWISGTWAAASVAGPLLGGVLAEHYHWSLVFWINIPLGLLAMVIVNKPLRKLPAIMLQHSIDWLGAALLVAATALLLLVLNWGGVRFAWTSVEVLATATASVVLWGLFSLRLVRAREPLIALDVLRNPIVLAGTLSMFMLQAANVGVSVYLPVYLQSVQGLSVSESGTALLGIMLGTVAGATFSGRAIPHVAHYKWIALFGIGLAIACLGALSYVAPTGSFLTAELLTIGFGLGSGTTFPVCTVAVQNAVDRMHLGVATGVLSFLRSLGAALGVALLGAVALGYGVSFAHEGGAATATASAMAFPVIFLAACGLLVLALAILATMPEKVLRGSNDAPAIAE